MQETESRDLLTTAAIRSIAGDPVLLGEYLVAVIGPADDRTETNEESAARVCELTKEFSANGVLRQRAPALAAIAALGRLNEIDWLQVVDAVVFASKPQPRFFRG